MRARSIKPETTSKMVKGVILVAALAIGLVALARGQEKDKEYFERLLWKIQDKKVGYRDSFFTRHLGFELFHRCDNIDRKEFAARLTDEGSNAYRCAIDRLADPEALISILRFAPIRPQEETSLYYLDKIRDHRFNKVNLKVIEDAILDVKRACQKYIDGIAPFFTEVANTDYVNSIRYGYEIVARNACQVLIKNDFSKDVIAKVGKFASIKYEYEKLQIKKNNRREVNLNRKVVEWIRLS